MHQGDIYLINLNPVFKSEIGKTRPGLILSIDAMNRYSPRLIIAPITSNVGNLYPFEILLKAGISGLDFDSKIMLDQIRSLDKRRIIRKLGTVDKTILVEACTIAQKLIAAS